MNIDAGVEAAERDIESGFVGLETAEDHIEDAVINCRQAEQAGDKAAGDFWLAYGCTLDKYFS